MFRPYKASYACGRRLTAYGCPLDYLQGLSPKSSAHSKRLYVRELGGYTQSHVLDFGLETGYVLPIVVGTDLPSGNIISEWSFAAPWDQNVCWDYTPFDVVPKWQGVCPELFDSRLSAVLNNRHLLARGRPVQGLLCGRASQPIPKIRFSGQKFNAELSLTDDTGRTVTLHIALAVDRSPALKRTGLGIMRAGGLLDKRDAALELLASTAHF